MDRVKMFLYILLVSLELFAMLSIRSFPPEPFFSAPDLEIRAIGIRETMPPSFVARPNGTEVNDCLLMIFHSPFQLSEPPHQTQNDAGCAVFWNRDDAQFYGNSQERWCHSWIHCSGDAVSEALSASGVECGRAIHVRDPARVERYLQNIYEDVTGPIEPDHQILRNTLMNLIREVARSGEHPRVDPIPEVLLRARHTIEARYDQRIELKNLARDSHLSVPHFCTEFRRVFGVTPIAYLIQRRLEAAATLLSSTQLDIGEIGRLVGYSDIYHFSKIFKHHFSVSPSKFRLSRAKLSSGLRR